MVAARSIFSTPNASAIQKWIVEGIARRTGTDPACIDVTAQASGLLDSLDAVDLSGEIANFLGIDVSPALLWEAPSISGLAQLLAQQARRCRRQRRRTEATHESAAAIFSVELSPEEQASLRMCEREGGMLAQTCTIA